MEASGSKQLVLDGLDEDEDAPVIDVLLDWVASEFWVAWLPQFVDMMGMGGSPGEALQDLVEPVLARAANIMQGDLAESEQAACMVLRAEAKGDLQRLLDKSARITLDPAVIESDTIAT